jgi:hypothetical protein
VKLTKVNTDPSYKTQDKFRRFSQRFTSKKQCELYVWDVYFVIGTSQGTHCDVLTFLSMTGLLTIGGVYYILENVFVNINQTFNRASLSLMVSLPLQASSCLLKNANEGQNITNIQLQLVRRVGNCQPYF